MTNAVTTNEMRQKLVASKNSGPYASNHSAPGDWFHYAFLCNFISLPIIPLLDIHTVRIKPVTDRSRVFLIRINERFSLDSFDHCHVNKLSNNEDFEQQALLGFLQHTVANYS